MQAREGDPLRLFLAFMEPLDSMEPTTSAWNPPDGEESLLIGSRSAASVFAGGRVITNSDGGDGASGASQPQVMLPPAA